MTIQGSLKSGICTRSRASAAVPSLVHRGCMHLGGHTACPEQRRQHWLGAGWLWSCESALRSATSCDAAVAASRVCGSPPVSSVGRLICEGSFVPQADRSMPRTHTVMSSRPISKE
jgi:hypothetical protein